MPWRNSPEDRAASTATYQDPEYQRNKAIVRRRSGGRCEVVTENGTRCGSADRVQCDHVTPVSQGGGHGLGNLRDTCISHHRAKSAAEGGGWRRRRDPPPQARTQW